MKRDAQGCVTSSICQGFFDFEVGDGGVGDSGVDVGGPVAGDGFVRAEAVVVVPVGVGLYDEIEAGIDLFTEQPRVCCAVRSTSTVGSRGYGRICLLCPQAVRMGSCEVVPSGL
jgi:hypothetical protein